MKKNYLLFLAVVLTGCAGGMLKKPQVLSVRKLAIVSVYANSDIHDVKAKPSEEKLTTANVLKSFVKGASQDKTLDNELVQIVTFGLKSYGEELGTIPEWHVLPPLDVIKSKEYQGVMKMQGPKALAAFVGVLQKSEESRWVTPPDMLRIPVSSLAKNNGFVYVDGKRVNANAQALESMAALCKTLKVDAVAIVGLELAYKTTMLSGMSGTGLFSNVRGKAIPAVSCEIALVDKNGELVVSGASKKPALSVSTPMMLKGVPDLKDKKGEAVENYCAAVKKSAEELKSRILAELTSNK